MMGKEFAPFRVFFNDLRAVHIRATIHAPGDLEEELSCSPNSAFFENSYIFPPATSLLSGEILYWRIIDLESGAKTKDSIGYVEAIYDEQLDNIIRSVEMGGDWEPSSDVRFLLLR